MGKRINEVVEIASDIKSRFDSWKNALTGLGMADRDKLTATQFVNSKRITDELAEALYHDDDLMAIIAEALPEDATRRGWRLSLEGEEESELPSLAEEYEKKLDFRDAFQEAAIWGRVFGGAVVYLGIDDGQEEHEPVAFESISRIRFATVLTKREIQPCAYYNDPHNDDKFGQPSLYRLNGVQILGPDLSESAGSAKNMDGRQFTENVKIHESRLLRFDGGRTSIRRRAKNNGWSDSIYQKIFDVMTQFDGCFRATAHLMQDAQQGVFKIQNLMDMISSGDKEVLQTRMELVDMSRSVARAIMVDADLENFERSSISLAGISDILQVQMIRLATAAKMPVTRLFQRSPAGQNSTGKSDTRNWYDVVEAYQTLRLQSKLEKWYRILFYAEDFEYELKESDKWSVRFNKLWQLSDKEQAELEKTVAEKDKINIDSGAILAEEVALNRWKAGGFSMDTQIDIDVRKEMLKAEIELAKDKAGEDPLDAFAAGGAQGEEGAGEGGQSAPPKKEESSSPAGA